ncbi:MAG TPA: glycosyltransferase, partial [Anseongella sp.]|nr:glycosyltransferase [Anseongella sp.]
MVETIIEFISVLLTVAYLVIVGSFIRGWNRLKEPAAPRKDFSTRVSVLIAARNEEQAIGRCLNAVFSQEYPPHLLEVIVIDDHSTDRTAEVAAVFGRPGPGRPEFRLIKMNERKPINSYKKKAIARAIEVARGELIVTTDADCWMGPRWLATVVTAYEEQGYKL